MLRGRWRKKEERKEEEALPGGVGVPEGERVRESTWRGGHESWAARGEGVDRTRWATRGRGKEKEKWAVGKGTGPRGREEQAGLGCELGLLFPFPPLFFF
jgi:hypothetical protein